MDLNDFEAFYVFFYKYNFNTVYIIGKIDDKILSISEVGRLLVNSIPIKVTNFSYKTYILPSIKKMNDKLIPYIISCEEYDVINYDMFGNNISHYILTSYKKNEILPKPFGKFKFNNNGVLTCNDKIVISKYVLMKNLMDFIDMVPKKVTFLQNTLA